MLEGHRGLLLTITGGVRKKGKACKESIIVWKEREKFAGAERISGSEAEMVLQVQLNTMRSMLCGGVPKE